MKNNETQPGLVHLQPSAVVIVLRILGVLFLLDTVLAFFILGFFGLNNFQEWHDAYIGVLLVAQTFKYIVVAVFVVKLFSKWAGRAYYLSGHHLIEKLGLVNTTETTYELSQVKSVVAQQSWLGRRFNFGTIKLKFAGSGKELEVILKDINNPNGYKDYFDQHLNVQGWVR